MEWLNYHHLFYFWVITQEGSLSAAAAKLLVSHSTLSAQLRALEAFLGRPLYERRGRRLVLTAFGAEVEQYAGDIFRLGRELVDVSRGHAPERRAVLRVGVVGTLPKTIVYRLLEASLAGVPHPSLHLTQGDAESLLALLSRNLLHVVLADKPPADARVHRAYAHLLGHSEVVLYGTPALVARYQPGFPRSLEGAPFLLPPTRTGLRRSMEQWLAKQGVRVDVVGEIDDAGLLRVFGAFGYGLFPVRAALAAEVEETHDVLPVGRLEGVRESYYAVTLERRVQNPLVATVIATGKQRLFPGRAR